MILRSMTSYGSGSASRDSVDVVVEVKSVNHRFLDTKVRLPKEYLSLESKVVRKVKETFARGRVDVFVQVSSQSESSQKVQVNVPLAKAYYDAMKELVLGLSISGSIELKQILKQPGVLTVVEAARDTSNDWELINKALGAAVANANEMRATEGLSLANDLTDRFANIRSLRAQIASATEGAIDQYRETLFEKVQGVLTRAGQGKVDEQRLLQEVTHLTDRADITEEVIRIASHLDQCDALAESSEPVGRRLDFLNQELLREANTIMSKSADSVVSRLALEIKVELEKVREQAQNIE